MGFRDNIYDVFPKVIRQKKEFINTKTFEEIKNLEVEDSDLDELAKLFVKRSMAHELTIDDYADFKKFVKGADNNLCINSKRTLIDIYKGDGDYSCVLNGLKAYNSEINGEISKVCLEFGIANKDNLEVLFDTMKTIESDKYGLVSLAHDLLDKKYSYLKDTIYSDYYEKYYNDVGSRIYDFIKSRYRVIERKLEFDERAKTLDFYAFKKKHQESHEYKVLQKRNFRK